MSNIRIPEHFPLANTYSMSFNRKDRKKLDKLREFTQSVARKLGLNDLKLSSSSLVAAPGIFGSNEKVLAHVKFHPILLVKKNTLPPPLQLKGPQDPKFTSGYVKEFERWFKDRFNIPDNRSERIARGTRHFIYVKNTDSVASFMAHLQEKPEMQKRILKFMVTRELLFLKKDREAPIHNFFGEMRSLSNVASSTFLTSLLGSTFVIVICSSSIPFYISAAISGIIATAIVVHALYNLIFIAPRIKPRERLICQEAIQLTNDIEAAKIFYKALNYSSWEDSFFLLRWIFRPIERLFGEFSESHIDSLAQKVLKKAS